ncbi:MAG: glycosyltransferase [Candidatus Limnocylindrales bacterium]
MVVVAARPATTTIPTAVTRRRPAERQAPGGVRSTCRSFGIIRPYKGLEVLVRAFDALPPEQGRQRFWLTVVGETWEQWSLPTAPHQSEPLPKQDHVGQSIRHRWRTRPRTFAAADAVMLPYLRSSISGPLHVAMGYGLPIVMSDVGGNAEAAAGYGGIDLVPPGDEQALRSALERLPERGQRSLRACAHVG